MRRGNRIGYALSPAGPANRQSKYGIYRNEEDSSLYVCYEGCAYDSTKGRIELELPLTGPQAIQNQPLLVFRPECYEVLRFFNVEDAVGPAMALLKLEIRALMAWSEEHLRQMLWGTSFNMFPETARAQARFREILRTLVPETLGCPSLTTLSVVFSRGR